MKTIHSIEDWGFLDVDERGDSIDVSPDFCEHFSINKDDCLGGSIHDAIMECMAESVKRSSSV